MGNNQTIYRANRVKLGLWIAFFLILAATAFWPPAAEYMRTTHFTGKLGMLDGLTPSQRMMAYYGFAGFMVAAAIGFGRVVLNDNMITIDDQGITVRHAWSTHSASWRDFEKVHTFGFGRYKSTRLIFRDGTSPEGGPNKRKLTLPGSVFGVDLKTAMIDAMVRLAQVSAGVAPRAGRVIARSTRPQGAAFGQR